MSESGPRSGSTLVPGGQLYYVRCRSTFSFIVLHQISKYYVHLLN